MSAKRTSRLLLGMVYAAGAAGRILPGILYRLVLERILDDRLSKAIVIILGVIIGLVLFNTFYHIPEESVYSGFFRLLLVPILAIAGAVIFGLLMIKLSRRYDG